MSCPCGRMSCPCEGTSCPCGGCHARVGEYHARVGKSGARVCDSGARVGGSRACVDPSGACLLIYNILFFLFSCDVGDDKEERLAGTPAHGDGTPQLVGIFRFTRYDIDPPYQDVYICHTVIFTNLHSRPRVTNGTYYCGMNQMKLLYEKFIDLGHSM